MRHKNTSAGFEPHEDAFRRLCSPPLISFEAACRKQPEKGSQGGTVRTHLRKPKISDRGNILVFDKGIGLALRNEPQRPAPRQRVEAERMSVIGRMACSISHDMRHSLTAIYANAEFLGRHDIGANLRDDLLLEIQGAVLAMTERIESLLQFGRSERKSPACPRARFLGC